jgi:long-chain acyl-CoA synthetase
LLRTTPMIEDHVPEILATLPVRISDVVKPWAQRSSDQPALIEAAGCWTYGQLASVIVETQGWLRHIGIRPGDRVMLVCENCRAFAAILLALAELDAWPVLVNARLSSREVDEVRDHCGARLVIYTTNVSPHAREHAKRHDAVTQEQESPGPIAVGPLNEKTEPEPVEADPASNIAALIYTSGTTGLPKGVMLTHKNLLFIAAISATIRSLKPADRLLGVLPMSHAVGLSVVLLGSLLSGASLYLAPRFDPVATLKALDKDQLTVVLGAPSMFALLLEYCELKALKSLRFPALRIISSSGAPLQSEVKARTEALFGMVLHNGYGVTECSPTIAQTRIEEPRVDISVGRVFPGAQVKLVGPDRQPVAEGEAGELWVHGPGVMKGYYRAPEQTADAIDKDGWFNTRDLARFENSHLFIIGRTKELIVRFGFNVYPAEIEAVFNNHPAVIRSAVIGRPAKAEGGEEAVAFIQLSPNSSVTLAELTAYAASRLAPYKRPSEIVFVAEIPVTPTGKIAKADLANKISAGLGPRP